MKLMRSAVLLFCFLTLVVGVIYPLVVTSLSQLLFPHQAEGSFIYGAEGGLLGSSLIGQPFSDPKYFWPRPSASADFPYNPLASGGSQLSPTNRVFLEQVTSQVSKLQTSGISRPHPYRSGYGIRERFGSSHQSRGCARSGPASCESPKC